MNILFLMDFKDFTAGKNDNDRRIDKVIRIFIKDISLSEIYKSIRKGLIKINKKKCKPETHVFEGDVISVAFFLLENNEPVNESVEKKSLNLDIVFENQHLIFINKPYDYNVHGDSNSLDKQVLEYYKSKNTSTSLSFTPGPLHRLDKKTTGLLAFSFSLEGARWFSENIQDHSINKIYYGILEGRIENEETWQDVITNDNEEESGFHKVKASNIALNDSSKIAITKVFPLSVGKYLNKSVTFCKINIFTGRKHQIRAQSALHGHPLLGDVAYGGTKLDKDFQSFYLHAGCLNLPENNLDIPVVLKAELPSAYSEFLKYCEIDKREL